MANQYRLRLFSAVNFWEKYMSFPIEKIETMIYTIRGHRVMLDSDLAKLYGVETKRLIEQVKRNQNRFPNDFLIIPTFNELDDLRSQFATSNLITTWNYKRRTVPMLFTENGVAMLSSVLNSEQAIEVNITIMRTFTKLRSFLTLDSNKHQIKIIFERLDNVEDKLEFYIDKLKPNLPNKRKKIGLKR
jgi:hypothetical protein